MANSDELITSVGKNSNDTAALVWSVADDLVGAYKPHEYGLVILPMTVIKRFHDCLLPTHQAVLDTYKKVEKLAVKDGFLRKASGYQFYNTSPFTFKTLIADPENIVDNFKAYLNGFSDNIQDILARMDFDSQIKHMEEAGLLYQVISDFTPDYLLRKLVRLIWDMCLKILFVDFLNLITKKPEHISQAVTSSIL